jgi:hypothetical protein
MPSASRLLFNFLPALALLAVLVWLACLLVQADVNLRVLAALGGFGQPGLAVSVDGRDLLLSGRAQSSEQLLAVRKAVAGLEGVRILHVAAEVEPPRFQPGPVELAPIEPVLVSYLVDEIEMEPVVEPAAAALPVVTKPKCAQTAVQMRGRRDAAQGTGATVCRLVRINLKAAE